MNRADSRRSDPDPPAQSPDEQLTRVALEWADIRTTMARVYGDTEQFLAEFPRDEAIVRDHEYDDGTRSTFTFSKVVTYTVMPDPQLPLRGVLETTAAGGAIRHRWYRWNGTLVKEWTESSKTDA